MVIWADFFLLELEFLVVEVVWVEAVDVVRAGFFVFSRRTKPDTENASN